LELRDLIVTPIVIIAVYVVAYLIRPRVTDAVTRRYFFPALTVRIVGALAVGFIYQFYYEGGDTYNFHVHGSRVIWEAFTEDFISGIKLLFSGTGDEPGLYKYTSRIWYYKDPQSFFVVKIAAVLDLITFSSYSGTAVLFSIVSFTGAWLMFRTFCKMAPEIHFWSALACLFIPTVFFWGSGIFKDTLTLAALGISFYFFYRLFVERRFSARSVIALVLSVWIIYSIKKYILLCFLPVAMFWLFSRGMARIRSVVIKLLFAPFALLSVLFLAYYTILKVGEDDPRYNLEKLAVTAQITAYDIRYGWGARTGEGSGYTLGELDGTWQNMVRLAPAAINVSLFRPYAWEIRNPLMVLSALESLLFLVATLFVIFKIGIRGARYLLKPEIIFCMGFAVMFAFAVGVSTYNFGTLSRYKIPLLPFYSMGLVLLHYFSKRERNVGVLDVME
jgi:hypothetical protein